MLKRLLKAGIYHNVCQLVIRNLACMFQHTKFFQSRKPYTESIKVMHPYLPVSSTLVIWKLWVFQSFNSFSKTQTFLLLSPPWTLTDMITQWNIHMQLIETQQPKKQIMFPSKELIAVCRSCAISTNHIHHSEAKGGRGTEDLLLINLPYTVL